MTMYGLQGKDKRPAQVLITLTIFAFFLSLPLPALAHPLGNFSINHYSGITIESDAILIHYVIDMAEIPTFQEIQESGITPVDNHPSVSSYLPHKIEELKEGLLMKMNGAKVKLLCEGGEISFPPGVGGLPTMKIAGRFRAHVDQGSAASLREVFYQDTNFAGRAGWKEIVVAKTGSVSLEASSVSSVDRSRQLSSWDS